MRGLIGIAVSLYDAAGRIRDKVSLPAPTPRFTAERALALAPDLQRSADAVHGFRGGR